MAYVNITNILFESECTPFSSPVKMSITFEVIKPLTEEIEWKLIYIGSPNDDKYDQVLDCFTMPPLQQGVMQFTLESSPPNFNLIPTKDDLFGATAIILTCKYKTQEFFRVGYYVYNNYVDPELIENDPVQVQMDKVYRQINGQKPRVTRFNIDWEGLNPNVYANPQMQTNHTFMFNPQQQQQQQQQQQVFGDLTNQFQQQQYQIELQKQLMQQQEEYSNQNQNCNIQNLF